MKLLSRANLHALLDFYVEHVEVEFGGSTYSSPPLVDREEVCAEWKIFKRAIVREKKNLIEKKKKKLSKPPSLQELMKEMESSGGYAALFPEIFKLIKNIARITSWNSYC